MYKCINVYMYICICVYVYLCIYVHMYIGPVTFSPPTEADLAQNSFTYMVQFLVQNDLCIISSMRPRPPCKLITYREIADLTND